MPSMSGQAYGEPNGALLVPVKAFGDAKARLASVLSPEQRAQLARWTATRVVDAAGTLPVFITCDDDVVAEWATGVGATVLWHPGEGLNAAVDSSVSELRELGIEHVVIAHGDLPLARSFDRIPRSATVTLVPDRRNDGTNVLAMPTLHTMEFSYGVRSFGRHLASALRCDYAVEVRHDAHLALDIDTPADLTHPLVREVLPSWLPTNLVNHPFPAAR
jgi:2-phospho-L-lactate/phosphoenolpyruvate guanylyltransferase